MRSAVCFLQSSNAASVCFLWAFPTLACGSGYIARRPVRTFGTPAPLLQRSLAPKNRRNKLPASLRPKGSLSLTLRGFPPLPLATQGAAYPATPCKTKNSSLISIRQERFLELGFRIHHQARFKRLNFVVVTTIFLVVLNVLV